MRRPLWPLHARRRSDDALVFTAERGGRIDQSNLMSRVLKPVAKAVGISGQMGHHTLPLEPRADGRARQAGPGCVAPSVVPDVGLRGVGVASPGRIVYAQSPRVTSDVLAPLVDPVDPARPWPGWFVTVMAAGQRRTVGRLGGS